MELRFTRFITGPLTCDHLLTIELQAASSISRLAWDCMGQEYNSIFQGIMNYSPGGQQKKVGGFENA